MISHRLGIAMGVAVLLLCGCGSAEDATTPSAATRLKKESKEALGAARDVAVEKKDEYSKRFAKQLEAMDKEMEALKAKAKESGAEMRKRYDEQLVELEKKREVLGKRFDEFTSSSKEAWQDMREGLDSAWDDLDKAFQKAKSRF